MAGYGLPGRQLRLPASVRQAYRYFRAEIWPPFQQLLLWCGNPHLRPRTQCALNHRWPSHRWHWRRRLDLHHHLCHLRSRPITQTRSLAGLRQRRVRHGNGSRRNCGWRLRRQRLLALGVPVPGALHRCLYHHGLVPDRHSRQPEHETTTSTHRLLRSYHACDLSRLAPTRSQHRRQPASVVASTRHHLPRPRARHPLRLPLHRIHPILGPRTHDPRVTDHPLPHGLHILRCQLVFLPPYPSLHLSSTNPTN